MRPKLVNRAKLPYYFRDLDRGLLEGVNLCEGCPYHYYCCHWGTTYWAPGEAERVAQATGRPVGNFTYGRENTGIAKGFYEGLNPCQFLGPDKQCTIYSLRPVACRRGICTHAYKQYQSWKRAHVTRPGAES